MAYRFRVIILGLSMTIAIMHNANAQQNPVSVNPNLSQIQQLRQQMQDLHHQLDPLYAQMQLLLVQVKATRDQIQPLQDQLRADRIKMQILLGKKI